MGTVLRVLVIVILVLSGAALFLAVKLYGKRELLINRTHLLEEQFREVAKTIEKEGPPESVQPTYVAKDISEVTLKELDNPERSTFWNTYQYKLETPNLPTLNLDTDDKQRQIRQYYQLEKDPASGKMVRVKDKVNEGLYSTKGPGTMQELLDTVRECAKKQNATLNRTRVELSKVREELGTTIEELNKRKQEGRADKKTIDELNKKIEALNEEIRGLKKKIEGLEEEKKALTAEVAEVKRELETKKAEIQELNTKIAAQEKEIKDLRGKKIIKDPTAPSDAFLGSPGEKGKVVAVDETLKFVVVELTPDAMTELIGEQREKPMPQVELMVRRPGFKSLTGEFITRIKFRQVLRQKNLVVADILIDWQQSPVSKDDVVFF